MKKLLLPLLIVGTVLVSVPAMRASQKPPSKTTDDVKASTDTKKMAVAALVSQMSGARPSDESLIQKALQWLDAITDNATRSEIAKQYIAQIADGRNSRELNYLGDDAYRLARRVHSPAAATLAFAPFSTAARMGDVPAANNVAYCLENGVGVEKDEQQAAVLYRQLGEKIPGAKDNYARCLQYGIGVARDEKMAAALYEEASDQGNACATFHYGYCVLNGIGVDKDEARAVEIIQQAAAAGIKAAMYELYKCYWNGWGVAQDREKAFKWLSKSEYKPA